MRDVINLDAIKADIKSEQAFQKRIRNAFYVIGVLIIIGLIYFFNSPERISRQYNYQNPQPTIDSLRTLLSTLMIFIIVSALIAAAIYYRSFAHAAARINQFAPAYVARTTPINILTSLWSFGLFIGIFLIIDISSGLFQVVLLGLGFYGFIIAAFLPSIIRYFYRRFIMSAYKGGLAKTEDMLRKRPKNADLAIMKAVLLMEQGQLNEAEDLYKQILQRKPRWGILNVPVLLNNLGWCLLFSGRYDEASDTLEAAIHTNPLLGNSYDSLATCYLEAHIYPAQALELTALALANTNAKMVDSLAIQQATAARAHALLGDGSAARQQLDKVQQIIGRVPFRPTQAAETNRQIGYTYLALGDTDAARTHFLTAIKLDPNGLYGKLAQQGLESIPT